MFSMKIRQKNSEQNQGIWFMTLHLQLSIIFSLNSTEAEALLQCEVLELLSAEVIFIFEQRPLGRNKEIRKFIRNSLSLIFCESHLYVYCNLYSVKQDFYHWQYKTRYVIDFCFMLALIITAEWEMLYFLNGQQCMLGRSGMANLFFQRSHWKIFL